MGAASIVPGGFVEDPKLPFHEVVSLFRRMSPEERAGLEASVRVSGVLEPVVLWRNPKKDRLELADGANRYDVWKKVLREGDWADGKPKPLPAWEFGGDELQLLSYVLESNRTRRHLSSSEKAGIAVLSGDLARKYDKTAAALPDQPAGDVAAILALEAGTNRSYIFECLRLRDEVPDLLKKVANGEINITEAKKILKQMRNALKPGQGPEPEENGAPQAAPPPPDEPPVIYDGLKRPVAPDFMHIFVLREDFGQLVRDLRKLKIRAEELADGPGGLCVHKQEVLADISHAIQHLRGEQPYAVCPHCDGGGKEPGSSRKKCEVCKGNCYVDKIQWKLLPAAERGLEAGGEEADEK